MQTNLLINQLYQICSSLISHKEKNSLLKDILNSAIRLIEADRGSIFLVKQKGSQKVLCSTLATGENGEPIQFEVTKGIASRVFQTGNSMIVNDVTDCSFFNPEIDLKTGYQTKKVIAVPLKTVSGEAIGVVELLNQKTGDFTVEHLQLLQVFALFSGLTIHNMEHGQSLSDHKQKVWELTKSQIASTEGLWTQSSHPELIELFSKLKVYAESDSNALIGGESGTGKEGISQLLHIYSPRNREPFVVVNCAAIPESLFEAEFFGVAPGAATGTQQRKGKVELANGGTLFLDEVGELPLQAQAKLLRVLQDKLISPVGSDTSPIEVDFRLVCATNRNLEEDVKNGKFREDLFYRINVIQLNLPPLRERIDDIKTLAESILIKLAKSKPGFKYKSFSETAVQKLKSYNWPGNIRQLHNKIENALIISENSDTIEDHHIELESAQAPFSTDPNEKSNNVIELSTGKKDFTLKQARNLFESKYIFYVLEQCHGNKTKAAEKLGMSREGLRKALKKVS